MSMLNVLLAVMLAGIPILLPAQSDGRRPAGISNVRFQSDSDRIVILYDLLSSGGKNNPSAGASKSPPHSDEGSYTVILQLRKDNDPGFLYVPKNIIGDIGTVRSTGIDKQIIWNVGEEFPEGLEEADYFFEVRLEQEETGDGGNNLLLWLGAGAAVLTTGVVTYYIVSGTPDADSPGTFPMPPGRPK